MPLANPLLEVLGLLLPLWNSLAETVLSLVSVVWIVVESGCNLVGDVVEVVLLPVWLVVSVVLNISKWNKPLASASRNQYPNFFLCFCSKYCVAASILDLMGSVICTDQGGCCIVQRFSFILLVRIRCSRRLVAVHEQLSAVCIWFSSGCEDLWSLHVAYALERSLLSCE